MTAALRSREGASNALLRAVQCRKVVPLATPALFLEYEGVLKRAEQLRASGLSIEDVDEFLEELAALVEPVEVHVSWRPQLKDPDDEMVLATAISGRADALVTYNLRDFRDAAPRFGVRVAKPGDILRAL